MFHHVLLRRLFLSPLWALSSQTLMDPNFPSATSSPAVPVPPLPTRGTFFPNSSRLSNNSSSTHSRRSLKSLSRLIADHRGHRDPKKLLGLINKLHEQLEFEKDRADRAAQQSSEALLYLKSVCEEKLHALRDIARLEEELKSVLHFSRSLFLVLSLKSYSIGYTRSNMTRLRKKFFAPRRS